MHSPYAREEEFTEKERAEECLRELQSLLGSLDSMYEEGVLLYDISEHQLKSVRDAERWSEGLSWSDSVTDIRSLERDLKVLFHDLTEYANNTRLPLDERTKIAERLRLLSKEYQSLTKDILSPFDQMKRRVRSELEDVEKEHPKLLQKTVHAFNSHRESKVVYHPDLVFDRALALVNLIGTSKRIGELDRLQELFEEGFIHLRTCLPLSDQELHEMIEEIVEKRCHDYILGLAIPGERRAVSSIVTSLLKRSHVDRKRHKEFLLDAERLYMKLTLAGCHFHKHGAVVLGEEGASIDELIPSDDLFFEEVIDEVERAVQIDFPNVALTDREWKKQLLLALHEEAEWRVKTLEALDRYKKQKAH